MITGEDGEYDALDVLVKQRRELLLIDGSSEDYGLAILLSYARPLRPKSLLQHATEHEINAAIELGITELRKLGPPHRISNAEMSTLRRLFRKTLGRKHFEGRTVSEKLNAQLLREGYSR